MTVDVTINNSDQLEVAIGGSVTSTTNNPGGSDTHIQYNSSGSFGGSSKFTYNGSNTVTLDGGGLVNSVFALNGSTDYSLIATASDEFKVRDTSAGVDRLVITSSGVSGSIIKDEDDFSSDSASHIPTQQSVKAYVDANAGGSTVTKYFNTTISETTSPTDLFSHTFTGGTLGATGQAVIKIRGYIYNNSGSTTNATLFLKWGGNTIFFDTTTTFANDTDYYGFKMDIYITNLNDTGTQYIDGEISINNSSDANQGRGDLTNDDARVATIWGGEEGGAPDITEDTTADQTFQIQVDPSISNANYQWVAKVATVEVI